MVFLFKMAANLNYLYISELKRPCIECGVVGIDSVVVV